MSRILTALTLLSHWYLAAVLGAFQSLGTPFTTSVSWFSGFSGHVVFSNLTAPRGIAIDANQNILVVERGLGISALTQVTSPKPGWNRTVVVENPDFTHGIQLDGRNLYVSTGNSVLVYRYDIATKSVDTTNPPLTLIDGIPSDGPVNTHTLLFETDATGRVTAILVGTGPMTDLDATARDPSSGRSSIRRYPIPLTTSSSYAFADGQTVAYGIRNPTGFSMYPSNGVSLKQLYVVDNAAELDTNATFSPTFSADNPADEFQFVQYVVDQDNNIPVPRFYGYPDCATLWEPGADPTNVPGFLTAHRGTQFSVASNPGRGDAWCMNVTNNVPPVVPFQAHTSPLDVKFFTPSLFKNGNTFPQTFAGDAFVSFHGSFGEANATGYGVVRVPFVSGTTSSNVIYEYIVQASNLTACPSECIRPVGLAFDDNGNLYVSSDASGEVFVITGTTI